VERWAYRADHQRVAVGVAVVGQHAQADRCLLGVIPQNFSSGSAEFF
jgi:hypothetical protein